MSAWEASSATRGGSGLSKTVWEVLKKRWNAAAAGNRRGPDTSPRIIHWYFLFFSFFLLFRTECTRHYWLKLQRRFDWHRELSNIFWNYYRSMTFKPKWNNTFKVTHRAAGPSLDKAAWVEWCTDLVSPLEVHPHLHPGPEGGLLLTCIRHSWSYVQMCVQWRMGDVCLWPEGVVWHSPSQLSVRGPVGGAVMGGEHGTGSWALCGRICFHPNGSSRFDVMRTRKHLVRNCQLWLNFISSLFLPLLHFFICFTLQDSHFLLHYSGDLFWCRTSTFMFGFCYIFQ